MLSSGCLASAERVSHSKSSSMLQRRFLSLFASDLPQKVVRRIWDSSLADPTILLMHRASVSVGHTPPPQNITPAFEWFHHPASSSLPVQWHLQAQDFWSRGGASSSKLAWHCCTAFRTSWVTWKRSWAAMVVPVIGLRFVTKSPVRDPDVLQCFSYITLQAV